MQFISKLLFAVFVLFCGILGLSGEVMGCSCIWGGPFLKVAVESELVVRGRVLSYPDEARGIKLSMDIEVLEVLNGQVDKRQIRVWGDTGRLCRPYVTMFPVGTEWIFALDGHGSKWQDESGYAISICGTYWLDVKDGEVIGNILDERDRNTSHKLPLEGFRRLFNKGGNGS